MISKRSPRKKINASPPPPAPPPKKKKTGRSWKRNLYTYIITSLKYENRNVIKTHIRIGVFRLCPLIRYTTPLWLLLLLLYCKSICKTTVRAFGTCKQYAPTKLGTQTEKIQTSFSQSNTSYTKLQSRNCSSRASVTLTFILQVLNCKFSSTVVSTVVQSHASLQVHLFNLLLSS